MVIYFLMTGSFGSAALRFIRFPPCEILCFTLKKNRQTMCLASREMVTRLYAAVELVQIGSLEYTVT